MFKCLGCGKSTIFPRCRHCGYEFHQVDGVYNLTEDLNANLADDQGVKYLGYDRVGSYYGGKNWLTCKQEELLLGKSIAELANNGLLLDLGCGNGRCAVPVALYGCTVIAADISRVMLKLLLQKAVANGADTNRIIPCRMNALSIPIADNSVDAAMIVSVLHLISEPEIVIRELHRVLRPGGKLVIQGNSPGLSDSVADELKELNRNYLARVGEFHWRYWSLLHDLGVKETRYSWQFDQHAACQAIFGNHTEVNVPFMERNVEQMSDSFLYRMGGKGFSDQQGVPDDLHEQVFSQVANEFQETYGPDFATVTCVTITNDIVLHVFEK